MNQPTSSHEESEGVHILSNRHSESLEVPMPSASAPPVSVKPNPSATQQTPKTSGSGSRLEVPAYNCSFHDLVVSITYKKFLTRLAQLNPFTLTRPAAEHAWKTLYERKGREEKSSRKDKKQRFLWSKANAQMRGKGLQGFNVEKFWRNWEDMAGRARKDGFSGAELRKDMAKQEMWRKKREESEEDRKLVERASQLQLQPKLDSRSEKAKLSGFAVFSGAFEQKFHGDDDAMEI